jgi:hypothetical protein
MDGWLSVHVFQMVALAINSLCRVEKNGVIPILVVATRQNLKSATLLCNSLEIGLE